MTTDQIVTPDREGFYGTLTVVCGPMFAGKTTEVLKRVLWARNGVQREVVVLKPAFDNRYADSEIVSHDGLRVEAISINEMPPNVARPGRGGLVVLDEVQFMTIGDLPDYVRSLLNDGVDVLAAGLDMDWQGHPFDVTASLLGMADEVIKAHAHCTVCGRPARKTWKKDALGGSVELGAGDKYESRCNTHWIY